jgi:hypothetical protein
VLPQVSAVPAKAVSVIPLPHLNPDPHLEGLSGWLIWVGLALLLAPLRIMSVIYRYNLPFTNDPSNRLLLAGHRASAILVASEIVTNTLFIVILLFLNYLFFTRKRLFPMWMIMFRVLHPCLLILNHLAFRAFGASSNPAKGIFAIVESLVGAAILIPYLLVSRRVKATFTR